MSYKPETYLKSGWYKDKLRSWSKRGINITYPEYCKKWIKQNKSCEICGKPLRLWYRENISPKKYKKMETANVDHDHRTGKVRGLLCNDCNRGLGHFERRKIDGLWFVNALKYLIKYNSIDTDKYKDAIKELKDLLNLINTD